VPKARFPGLDGSEIISKNLTLLHNLFKMIKLFRKIFSYQSAEKEDDKMKYLITGLGNMGPDYEGTRHNIGFEVIDHLCERFDVSLKDSNLGFMAEIKHKGRTIHLLKPTTYMNLSGKAIRHWMTKLDIPVERSLVVLDDVNLEPGVVKLKPKGSDGGHNGLKSIQQMIGTNKFPRLRIGIGRNFHSGDQVRYVLGKWSSEERETIDEAVVKASEACLQFATIGIQHTMNSINK